MRQRGTYSWVMALALGVMLFTAGPTMAAQQFGAHLNGGQETNPSTISTTGTGFFFATLNDAATQIDYTLVYFSMEAPVTVAHIHLGAPGVTGGVAAFLCGGGGKPACPDSGVFLTGTIVAADVVAVTGQGIAAGELAELVQAMRAGLTYANVHTVLFPPGEIRGQILR
ncbi:MAG: CHRD domain-containing protein [Candidatus Methylomirabilis oxyfera]|nr:CHRD domain-containing protein [Candidatus Methylomirabilis oxyfera]